MAIDFASLLYGPVYDAFGISAVLVTDSGQSYAVNVIDKTSGIEVEQKGGTMLMTVRPAAFVRACDLQALGLKASDLDDAELTMNDRQWTVKAVKPLPALRGTYDGQFALILIESEESADD